MDRFKSIWVEYTRSQSHRSLGYRLHNIHTFAGLDRLGLVHGQKERILLMQTTPKGERIHIQYPGKESVVKDQERVRPWDFRPKLERTDGTFMEDLSFTHIWDDLGWMGQADSDCLAVLATIFFRMSLMIGYLKTREAHGYTTVPSGMSYSGSGSETMDWHKLHIPSDVLSYLDERIVGIRGVSLEAYLMYNDLLAQNEDCKYFYRDEYVKKQKWTGKTGRVNTMRTHISVIAFLEKKLSLSKLAGGLNRGVMPYPIGQMSDVTKGLVTH